MSQNINLLEEVTVVSSALERSRDVGMGQQIIGIADIEKIAGGNRDISRVVRTYPGVSFSPIGYRITKKWQAESVGRACRHY